MSSFVLISAQLADPKDLGGYWYNTNISKAGVGTLIAAISVVTVLILVWAIFIRKPDDDRPRRYRYPKPAEKEPAKDEEDGGSDRHGRRKKRRRREHRVRKPTLAETGGLPPLRKDLHTDDPP